jgi:hypothetical protein
MFYSWATFFQAQYSVFGRRNKLSARQPELITQPAACVQIIGRPAHPVIHQPQPHSHQPVTISHLYFPLSSHYHQPPPPSLPTSRHHPSYVPTKQPLSAIFSSHYPATSTSQKSATINRLSFPLSSGLHFSQNQHPSAIFTSHYPATSTSHQSATISHISLPLSSHLNFPSVSQRQLSPASISLLII